MRSYYIDIQFAQTVLSMMDRFSKSHKWPLEPQKILPIHRFIKVGRFKFPEANNAAEIH